MFLHDYFLACEISSVRTQTLIIWISSYQLDKTLKLNLAILACHCRDKTTINFQYIYHITFLASRKFHNSPDPKQMPDSN